METTTEQQPSESTTQPSGQPGQVAVGRSSSFVRRHPMLTVIGAAGASLAGGLELAAGVLIGAGLLSIIKSPRITTQPNGHARTPLSDRMPEVRKRARAVMQAVRGKIQPATV